MSETVKIILTGKVRTGFERDEVIATLAKIFKLTEVKATALLAGRETVVKRDVPVAVAGRHLQVLRQIGAEARGEAIQVPAPVEPVLPRMESDPNPPPADSNPATSRPSGLALELVPIAVPEPPTEPDPRPYAGLAQTAANGPAGAAHRDRVVLPAGVSVMTTETPPMFGFSMSGRIGRLRYLVYGWLGITLVAVAAALLLVMTGFSLRIFSASGTPGVSWLIGAALTGILVLWLSIRVSVLRLHDVNLSGKWILLVWILPAFIAGITRSPALMTVATILSWLVSFVLLLWPGSSTENDYGDPPGANTLLIYLGTLLVILLGAIGIRGYSHYLHPQMQPAGVYNPSNGATTNGLDRIEG